MKKNESNPNFNVKKRIFYSISNIVFSFYSYVGTRGSLQQQLKKYKNNKKLDWKGIKAHA